MIPTITVDARKALLKFSPAGIPEQVRKNLRTVIPDLTKRLGLLAEEKLNTELKSRKNIDIKKEMVESPTYLYGRVRAVWTGPSKSSMVPAVLDTGAKAHWIEAKPGGALFFFWEKLGKNVAFQRVWHPGFGGINYMQRSLDEMHDEIVNGLLKAAKDGAKAA